MRDGILCHNGEQTATTLEGQVVAIADKIAYINHDIDDAIRGDVLTEDDIPKKFTEVLGSRHSQRIDSMILGIINESYDKPEIKMEKSIFDAMMGLRDFMFERVYISSKPKQEESKAYGIIEGLYNAYSK